MLGHSRRRRVIECALLCVLVASLAMIPTSASAQPPAADVDALPRASEWKRHFEQDILPFWQTAMALGEPVGNFPTFRCNDGAVYDPERPCAEYQSAPDWIKSAVGRQYVRMISRQVYLYGVAFHLTGDPKYLIWCQAGIRYILDHAFDRNTGNVASYWNEREAFPDPPGRTSQDLAYALVGLSFYYYLTRDPQILQPILQIEHHIRERYYDSARGLYRWKLSGPEADRLELVAQLDQANAYMLLLTPLLAQPYQKQWRAELSHIAGIIRDRFYDRASSFFVGSLDPKSKIKDCIFAHVDTDFGHTIKTYWMLYFIGRITKNDGLVRLAQEGVPGILQRAYMQNTGSWGTQPVCGAESKEVNPSSTWWMAAELDQAALTFGIGNAALLRYIPQTYAFWLEHMVDHRYGEVWDEVTVPDYTAHLPKLHLWKNGFHTAEHALVGYIATGAIRSEPVVLYYAFADCKIPETLQPYYFEAAVTARAASALQQPPGFCRVEATFSNVH